MRRWLLMLFCVTLVSCGGRGGARPTASPQVSAPATVSDGAAPTVQVVIPTAKPAAVEPAEERATLAPLPSSTSRSADDSLAPAMNVLEVTLAPSLPACAGEGLSIAEDGAIATSGQRDGKPCASLIDLATGSVQAAGAIALPGPPGDALQASDPVHGRLYVAESGAVTAYDAGGAEIERVLTVPPGEPAGASFDTALRLNEAADRIYLSYQDFDGQSWIAMADLTTGAAITDVPVPSGPWVLVGAQAAGQNADGGERLLFADADTLLVLDSTTLEAVGRLSLSRRPVDAVADLPRGRLFVTDAGGDLYVLDGTSLEELDRLPGLGAAVDLDPQLGQLYVGDRFSGGVHVLDLRTLEQVGRVPQPGRPSASPADGRVYILEEGVYQADGLTLDVIRGRTVRDSGCNGCAQPTGVAIDPRSGLVYSTTSGVWSGKPGPTSQVSVDGLTGRAFVARTTGGYQPVFSLALYPDLRLEEPLKWIDGLYGQLLYDPGGDRLYLAHNGRLLMLDGQTLDIQGGMDFEQDLVLLATDGSSGGLYATQGERLLRLELRNAFASGAELGDGQGPLPTVGELPGPVYGIVVSPHFAQDATLLAVATDWKTGLSALYRSRDGGESWVRLQGGLPGPPNDLAYAVDGRLYAALGAAAWRSAPEAAIGGEGVYVSEDGGDTWRPYNAGLAHLRVGRVHAGADGTLYARAAAAAELGHAASGPTIWARPPDKDWMPLTAPGAGPFHLVDYTIPATYTVAVQAYWHALAGSGPLYQSRGEELHRSDDGGQTWSVVGRGPVGYAEDVLSGNGSVYWVGPAALWRSTDQGATWSALRHPALAGRPPFLVTVTRVAGAETLFLGTDAGRVLIVPVNEADWEALQR